MTDPTDRHVYPIWASDTARYGDTDINGHLNNAAFCTFLETGRITFLADPRAPLIPPGHGLAIVRLVLDFRSEMRWGGPVEIGSAITRIGRSSFTMAQAIFQDGQCTATADCVLVVIDLTTRRSVPIDGELRSVLEANGLRPVQ